MKRHIIAFILLLTLVLSWGRAPAVAAESVAARPPETALAGNPHSLASVDLSNWIHTLLNTRAPRTLTACTTPPSAIKIMPLGDSITKGNDGVEPPTELAIGYRLPLYMSLRNSGYNADFVGSLDHGTAYPNFDTDHEGHGGWTDAQVAAKVYDWLDDTPSEIILLHIGTNGLDSNPTDVEDILDNIEQYQDDHPGTSIKVIVARIINRIPFSSTTTTFNNNVVSMISGHSFKNNITIVDMENGAGIVYALTPVGDMADNLHPYATGYEKMAAVWFNALNGLGLTSCSLSPKIHSLPVTEARVGQAYTYQVVASGNPSPTFELIKKPSGMAINTNTGLITWEPGAVGPAEVTVRASNGVAPTSSQTFTIQVIEPEISTTISPAVQYFNNSGATANFTIAITNTGSIKLTNIAVSVPNAPNCNRSNLGSLNPGQFIPPYGCSLSNVTTADEDKLIVASVTAQEDPGGTNVTGNSNIARVDILPKITLAQQNPANVSHPAPGGPVNFTLKVTNNSSETVTLTSLWNDNMGELTNPGNPKVASTDCSNSTVIAASSNVTCHVTATFTGAQDNTYNVFVEATAEDDEGNEASASAGGTMVTITEPPIKYTYLPFVLSNP